MKLNFKVFIFILIGSLLVLPKVRAAEENAATEADVFVMDIKVSDEALNIPDGMEEIEDLRPDKDVGGVLLRLESELAELKKEEIDISKLEKQYGQILREVANQDPHFLDTKEADGIYEKDIFDYAKELYNKDI